VTATCAQLPISIIKPFLLEVCLFARNLLDALSFTFTVWVILPKLPVRERLAVGLLIHRDRFSRVEPPLEYLLCSRTDLADFIGASIEPTVRALGSFRDSGCVKSRGKNLQPVRHSFLH
jgi:CRP-like cAMP-binding protein